jgi:ABC-type Fe2+-enterobactin transport system substrate-binding protein
MPMNTIASANLSSEESRNAPFLEDCLVTLATLPSIMSKKPEIKRRILPLIEA